MISSTYVNFSFRKSQNSPLNIPLASQIQGAEQHRERPRIRRSSPSRLQNWSLNITAVPGKPMTRRRRRTPRGSRAGWSRWRSSARRRRWWRRARRRAAAAPGALGFAGARRSCWAAAPCLCSAGSKRPAGCSRRAVVVSGDWWPRARVGEDLCYSLTWFHGSSGRC